MSTFKDSLFAIRDEQDFAQCALQNFHFQYEKVEVYRRWCAHLGCSPSDVKRIDDIPFLPIHFFKTHAVLTVGSRVEQEFLSSGTGGQRSKHYIADEALYRAVSVAGFERRFGALRNRPVFALLPHYLEQRQSSLVRMCQFFMEASGHADSGFYLNNRDELMAKLQAGYSADEAAVLFGASYALLDLAESAKQPLENTLVFETGGMKGRRKEMVREELHAHLRAGLGVKEIQSEYGMTELLSQAYLGQEDAFVAPPWMQLRLRDARNPLDRSNKLRRGCINVIDLANRYSCSFIATDDLGERSTHGIRVLGRLDMADIRGCNLLVV